MKEAILGFLQYLGFGLVAFFSPITYAFIFAVSLVVVDTTTGIMAAGSKDIKNIESKKAFRLVPKGIFYFFFISLAHFVSVYVDASVPFVKLVLVAITFIEVKSIDENYEKIFGYSFLNKIIEGVKKFKDIKRYKEDEVGEEL